MPRLPATRAHLLIALLATSLMLPGCSSPSSESADRRVTRESSEWGVAGIVGGRVERTTSEPVTTTEEPAPEPPELPRPEAAPQAGLLTAGDHDDLLNSDLYARYAGRFLQSHGGDLPFVDTRSRVAVRVVDAAGRPVPFAQVDVERQQAPLHLTADASGTVSFYPKFDRVPARTTLTIASSAGAARRVIDLGESSSRRISVSVSGGARPAAAMDVALAIDTTGSMGDEMAYLQAELDSIVARLRRQAGNIDLRIGLIVYRDEGDDYVVRSTPLTSDIGSVREVLAGQSADGGGDTPEAVDQAMAAAERLQWRPNAAKAMLLVADAPPHEDGLSATLSSGQRLRSRGVQIVPVAASGVDDSAQYLMRTLAALTQGRYIFLTDDSGVGNPHAEPDVDCYVVTHLDQLIARVLAGVASGRRIEPARSEIIRMVGNYDRGRCLARRPGTQS